MPSAADEYQDALIARQVLLLRLQNGLGAELRALLNATDQKTMAILRRELEKLGDLTPVQIQKKQKQLNDLIAKVSVDRGKAWKAAEKLLDRQLIEIGTEEAAATIDMLETAMPVKIAFDAIPPEQIIGAVRKRPFQGAILKDWAQGLSVNDRRRMAGIIRQGVVEGRTIDEIVRSVRGTRAGGFKDGILEIGRREAEAVVRTAVQHTTNAVRGDIFEANRDVIAGSKWVSTLDGRTTPVCRDRDGRVVMYHGHPTPAGMLKLSPANARPPAHFNCRSVMVAIFDPTGVADKMGERPFVRDTRTRRFRERDFRKDAKRKAGGRWSNMTEKDRRGLISVERRAWTKANVGRVASETSYQDWLKRQPPKFQDEVLGPARGKLFRSGKETVHSFVDKRGRTLTLAELSARRASAS